MPVDHDGGGGEDGAVGERPDLGEAAALVGEDPVELGDSLLVDAVLQVLVGLEGQQLGDDDRLSAGGGHHQRLALVVARAVLEQEVDHAQVAVTARLNETGRTLEHERGLFA